MVRGSCKCRCLSQKSCRMLKDAVKSLLFLLTKAPDGQNLLRDRFPYSSIVTRFQGQSVVRAATVVPKRCHFSMHTFHPLSSSSRLLRKTNPSLSPCSLPGCSRLAQNQPSLLLPWCGVSLSITSQFGLQEYEAVKTIHGWIRRMIFPQNKSQRIILRSHPCDS